MSPDIKHAVYIAISLHMVRKILRKTLVPKTQFNPLNSTWVFKADENKVREGTRKARALYREEPDMIYMTGIDVAALLRGELQGEIHNAVIKKTPAIKISEEDVRRGLVSRVHRVTTGD